MTRRIGVVGLGGMGRTHATSVVDAGHDVVAGADVQPAARERFTDAFDAATFEDFEAMYEEADVDGVIVTTPNAFHEPASVAAFERDIDVLCEKPLAASLDAAERMVEAEAASDARGMVGVQSRFRPSTRLFSAYRDEGRFGDVRHVEVRTIRQRGIPGVGSWFTNRELAGGGALIDIGVHVLDRSLHMLEFPELLEVSATTRADFGGRGDYADPDDWGVGRGADEETFDVEDSASGFVRCAGGTTLSFEVAWAANRPSPTNSLVVWGTEGGAVFGRDGLRFLDADVTGVDHYVETEISTGQNHSAQAQKVEAFLADDHDGPAASFAEGLAVQRLMDAIYRSAEKGGSVTPN